MHARFYNPQTGRFLSVDAAGSSAKPGAPQTWNRYSYVGGNPLKYVDPDGNERAAIMQDVAVSQLLSGEISTQEYTESLTRPGPAAVVAAGAAGVMAVPALGGGSLAASLGNAFNLASATARGNAIESTLAGALGGGLPRTFPVIDRFKDGVATSAKSLDLAARSYQNASNLGSRLTGFIDKLANFSGGRAGGFEVKAEQVTQRVLELVVQRGNLTPQQAEALRKAAAYAAEKGVTFKVYVAK